MAGGWGEECWQEGQMAVWREVRQRGSGREAVHGGGGEWKAGEGGMVKRDRGKVLLTRSSARGTIFQGRDAVHCSS